MLLYIHIPFCDSKCYYCAFNSYVDRFHLKKLYIKSLKIQLQSELKQNIETVFIGGGTPSTIDIEDYQEIFKIINPYIDNSTEITIEANPNSATRLWLKGIKSLGINRISFGVQSFDNKKLKFLNRNHTKDMAIAAINLAKEIGFKNINLDIIYGTTLDNKELLNNDLNIIKNLPINHISAYSLVIEEGTKFFNTSIVAKDDENLAIWLFQKLKDLGFNQYEISNFAKNDISKSKHNIGYWSNKEYLGIGAGAVGRVGNIRYYPHKSIEKYIKNPLEYEHSEILSTQDKKEEKLLLGLRSEVGVDIDILNDKEIIQLKDLIKFNKIQIIDKRFYNLNYLLSDELVLYLLK